MAFIFPTEVDRLATEYQIKAGVAFGLGEGLNLYYTRRSHLRPPHRLHILSTSFSNTLQKRVEEPRREAMAAALVGNAYGVMVCTGDSHGLDAIEKWAEEIYHWPQLPGWEMSIEASARLIEESDGLYRRSYVAFLDEAQVYFDGLEKPRQLLHQIADDWLQIATRLRAGEGLARLSSRILRMASQESRFWGLILDQFRDFQFPLREA